MNDDRFQWRWKSRHCAHPNDGGMVSVVEGLTSWTTLGGRTADGSPGTDGDGTEMACCGT